MILYSFQCEECNQISEQAFNMSDCPKKTQCPICQGTAAKIISIPGPHLASESPGWIKSIREVVNKEGGRHCQEFLKDPTRKNYHKWMAGEGVRHMEAGEKPGRPPSQPPAHVITDKIMQKRMDDRRIRI